LQRLFTVSDNHQPRCSQYLMRPNKYLYAPPNNVGTYEPQTNAQGPNLTTNELQLIRNGKNIMPSGPKINMYGFEPNTHGLNPTTCEPRSNI
jgi:hypothetical protein